MNRYGLFLFFLFCPFLLLASPRVRDDDAVTLNILTPAQARRIFFRARENCCSEKFFSQRVRFDGQEGNIDCQGKKWTVFGKVLSPEQAPNEPIVPGSDLRLFDLQMPFFSWPQLIYEGPAVFLGRSTQRFSVLGTSAGSIVRVYIWIDSRFALPLGWDGFDAEGKIIRQFRVRSFARRGDGWTVKRLQWRNLADSQRVEMEILE